MKDDSLLKEKELIKQLKKGNKEAYRHIVNSYMRRAYYIALGFVHNEQDALDISQEAFIKAYRKIKNFNPNKKFFPWFYQIIRNLCFDHIKKRKKINEIPLDGVRILNTEKEDREMKKVLWEGIDDLPLEQKEIIILRYFQEFSYQEIAQILNKPTGSIMSSLYYAKRKLKKELEKYL
ncbi:MAG: RNA polymerase sigma factor [Candidatus Aminicenantia bacterium]